MIVIAASAAPGEGVAVDAGAVWAWAQAERSSAVSSLRGSGVPDGPSPDQPPSARGIIGNFLDSSSRPAVVQNSPDQAEDPGRHDDDHRPGHQSLRVGSCWKKGRDISAEELAVEHDHEEAAGQRRAGESEQPRRLHSQQPRQWRTPWVSWSTSKQRPEYGSLAARATQSPDPSVPTPTPSTPSSAR